ncbi:DUF2339 domain-containing protein [Bradyrhizobium sp. U87765 SZCCT0131]|uniref:DUF2339 domain-containing protein n=1 Tax=unclassified Bradyrhizobium TaxID=2631580 RepID=UPI001BAB7684|nr:MULTISPECIES: DUF2339 domain-containing protein [unclassified Bradyrhizobium]MBR1218094.1 DUF2339 domain-containing protein [Bradyrhizobium sp. U87765 SZCCT0131]MBR1260960.1 DUF2339 domain-containing protein [Bradyrhizobium sp. U87765 SZCCT0134]MBR1303592.1 DUF2339 domain-containing protein [Bradyrhizobium sp. U87765 SZCCT0110]MBR1319198.1 DUF2339 domain-containing protein [Bradyrhizobium sp. U87765 SZCCT0109]MBR1347523.1 DUF2339 domain-containing protein [Bradyrhizobium sp. U87765 SZCCT004
MEFLALIIAIVAAIFARKALTRSDKLAERVVALEAALKAAPAAATTDAPIAPAIGTPTPPPDIAAQLPIADSAALAPGAVSPPPPPPQPQPEVLADVPPVADAPPTAPVARPGLEERLGTRWAVWLGGVTLALGGLFLVRYSIEQGLIGPGVRVLLGGLFALALLAAGEITRSKDSVAQIPVLPIANIPAILTAAGTVVAFATVYVSYALYDFLAPAAAFLLLGAVALGTLAAALLHGPALGGLGLAAAFVTPILVSSGKPDYWALYVYLAVVTAAAFALARLRLWRWLAVTTVVFALLWLAPCLQCGPSMIGPHTLHVIAGFALAAGLVVCGFLFGPTMEHGRVEPVSSGALAAYLLGATLIVLAADHAASTLVVFTLLIASTIAIAWRAEAAIGAVAAGAVMSALVFLSWVVTIDIGELTIAGGAMAGVAPQPQDASVSAHLIAAAVVAAGFGIAGFAAQGRSIAAAVPVIWAATATFTPLALLIALYARIAAFDRSIPFAIVAVVLAAAYGAATEALNKREHRPGLAIATALFATATLGALALALTFALEKGWLTIALALMSAGTAWIANQRPIPFLRWLAAILTAIVTLRIGYEPRIAGAAVGTTPVLNWLLWGYGVPALSFWTAAHLLRRRGDDVPLRMMEAAAILFTVLLAFMEIRHAINRGDVYAPQAGLAEVALQVCVAIAMAIGLERLRLRSGSIVHNIGAIVLAAYAAGGILLGLLTSEWPLFTGADVGGAIIGLLTLGYALPAVLALGLARTVAPPRRPAAYGHTIAGVALVLALAFVSLEVRRFYQGPVLTGSTTDSEQYAYSVVWLLFGVALLAVGFVLPSQRARLASAVIIGLTVLKVFVIDMSVLTGVFRALSFMGLGLVLVSIGWLYQRLLLRRRPPTPDAGQT